MKLCMFSLEADQAPRLGVVLKDGRILDCAAYAAKGDGGDTLPRSIQECAEKGPEALHSVQTLLQSAERHGGLPGGAAYAEGAVKFHPPVARPGKFFCVGKNSRGHLEELVRTQLIKEMPEEPTGFIKISSAIAAHDDEVKRPDGIVEFDYEAEMAFVIGKGGLGVPKDKALEHVLGITVINDLTAREIQRREVKSGTKFWTAKNMPGFGPIGPYVVTLDEISDLKDLWLICRVNGEVRNRFSTADLIYDIPAIIEHFSRYVLLEPGDVFATGAAGGIAAAQENAAELYLKPGDVVEASIENVVTLRNTIN